MTMFYPQSVMRVVFMCLLSFGGLSGVLASAMVGDMSAESFHSMVHTFEASVMHKVRSIHGDAAPAQERPLSHAIHYHIAKFQQEEFCKEYYGLPIPDTRAASHDGHKYNITVLAANDIVSGGFVSGRGWEDHDVALILEAMAAPLPDNAPEQAKNAKPVFLDIGANLGTFTLGVAAHGYDVLAVEGSRSNRWALRTSICSNPKLLPYITLYPFGLGARRETCYVVVAVSNAGNGNAVCDVSSAAAAVARMGSPHSYRAIGTMQLYPLDNIINQQIRVMKLDVEGHEPNVLAGARRLLSQGNVWFIYMEVNTLTLSKTTPLGVGLTDFIVQMMRMGYNVSRTSWDGPWFTEQEVLAWAPKTVQEVIFNIMLRRMRW